MLAHLFRTVYLLKHSNSSSSFKSVHKTTCSTAISKQCFFTAISTPLLQFSCVCVFHMCVHVCLCVHLHTCVCCLIVVSVIVKHPGLPFVWKMGTIQVPFIIIINKTGLQCLCLKMSYTWLMYGKATFTTTENPANSLSFWSVLTLRHRSGQT